MVLRSEQIAQEAVGDNQAERRGKDVREGRKEVNHMAENTACVEGLPSEIIR